VYLNAIGGAAQFYARSIDKVLGVSLLDSVYLKPVEPARARFHRIVTMDAHGNSLHADLWKRPPARNWRNYRR